MNGYLYVASRDERYLKAACQSAESLLEFHPKAKITLFTEDRWEGTYDKTLFDNVFSCDDHVRASVQHVRHFHPTGARDAPKRLRLRSKNTPEFSLDE